MQGPKKIRISLIALLFLFAAGAIMPWARGQDFIDHEFSRSQSTGAADLAAAPATEGLSVQSRDLNIEALIDQLDEALVTGYLEEIVAFPSRVTESNACRDASQYIYDEFVDMGLDVRFHYWNYYGMADRNVEATLHPTGGSSNEIYIVCAHHDCVDNCPGADDNGSGTAAVLSLAKLFSNCSFDGEIRFVTFSGEEQGIIGSQIYASEARLNGDNIVAVLNADMIGFTDGPSTTDKAYVYYDNPSAWIKNAMNNTAQQYFGSIGLNMYPVANGGGSDHLAFWWEGYQAIFLHEYEFNNYYHSSGDTIAHMDLNYLMRCTWLLLATLGEIAGPFTMSPLTDIKVDGLDGPLTIPASQDVTMTISLDPFDQVGVSHDWWVGGLKNTSTLYCWTYSGGWIGPCYPTRAYVGPLFGVTDYTIHSGKIPVGTWQFVFAVDELNNSYEGTHADSIEVTSY